MQNSNTPGEAPSYPEDPEVRTITRTTTPISFGELVGVVILWAAKSLLFLLSVMLFLTALIIMPDTVFPNNAGWHDIDNMEILYCIAWAFLTFRYIRKVSIHKARIGRAIYRYFIAFGITAMAFSFTILAIAFTSEDPRMTFYEYQYSFEFIAEIAWLAILFSIVPKGKSRFPRRTPEKRLSSISPSSDGTSAFENGEKNV